MKSSRQMSESIELGVILAIAGGFMDAYSYMCRGQVFANAQTGNMLLFGINLSEGNFKIAFTYFCPVMAFAIGILLADIVKIRMNNESMFHWRQVSVFFEIAVLLIVSYFNQKLNLLANSLTSLACGIQVESFRKIHGNGIATTMCIGNLRSGTQNICNYFCFKEKDNLFKGFLYYGIILFFIIGAIIGNFCVKLCGEKAIRICAFIHVIAFIMMFVDREKSLHNN